MSPISIDIRRLVIINISIWLFPKKDHHGPENIQTWYSKNIEKVSTT